MPRTKGVRGMELYHCSCVNPRLSHISSHGYILYYHERSLVKSHVILAAVNYLTLQHTTNLGYFTTHVPAGGVVDT